MLLLVHSHSFLYQIQKLFYLIIRMNNSVTLSLGLTIQKNHTSKFIMFHHCHSTKPILQYNSLYSSFALFSRCTPFGLKSLMAWMWYVCTRQQEKQRGIQQIMYLRLVWWIHSKYHWCRRKSPPTLLYSNTCLSRPSLRSSNRKLPPSNTCNLCHLSFAHKHMRSHPTSGTASMPLYHLQKPCNPQNIQKPIKSFYVNKRVSILFEGNGTRT